MTNLIFRRHELNIDKYMDWADRNYYAHGTNIDKCHFESVIQGEELFSVI